MEGKATPDKLADRDGKTKGKRRGESRAVGKEELVIFSGFTILPFFKKLPCRPKNNMRLNALSGIIQARSMYMQMTTSIY